LWKKSFHENEEGRMQNEENDLAARTKDFARRIIRLYCALPKETVAQVLGKQVLRSGTSVGANYREANRARSKAEFVSKIGDCLKETDETVYWLELLMDEKVVSSFFERVCPRCFRRQTSLLLYSLRFRSALAATDFCILHSTFCLKNSPVRCRIST
jgi:four helix bundle protein